jgi:hypothetical protein
MYHSLHTDTYDLTTHMYPIAHYLLLLSVCALLGLVGLTARGGPGRRRQLVQLLHLTLLILALLLLLIITPLFLFLSLAILSIRTFQGPVEVIGAFFLTLVLFFPLSVLVTIHLCLSFLLLVIVLFFVIVLFLLFFVIVTAVALQQARIAAVCSVLLWLGARGRHEERQFALEFQHT